MQEHDKGRFAFEVPARLKGIDGVQPLELTVADVTTIAPRLRRVRLSGAGPDFAFRAGQDVMLVLGGTVERPLSRRYTIRAYDPRTDLLELNLVLHGPAGPGATWAAETAPGDRVNGVGPRGKIFVDPAAEWHLFLGDESAIAATLAMLETLPAGTPAAAYLEVPGADDQVRSGVGERVTWLHRGATPAELSELLVAAMRAAEVPAGRGRVYINGEVRVVAAVREAALARGVGEEAISPKAYWGRGKANANNGEPERA
jgi:NADPH-dependent ferric siderophore reductase